MYHHRIEIINLGGKNEYWRREAGIARNTLRQSSAEMISVTKIGGVIASAIRRSKCTCISSEIWRGPEVSGGNRN